MRGNLGVRHSAALFKGDRVTFCQALLELPEHLAEEMKTISQRAARQPKAPPDLTTHPVVSAFTNSWQPVLPMKSHTNKLAQSPVRQHYWAGKLVGCVTS